MSTLAVNKLQSLAGLEYGKCLAWVNFNGTGTVAIRKAMNVSSITDNGVGDYTVNFTAALPDANYFVTGIATDPATTNGTLQAPRAAAGNQTVNNIRVGCVSQTASPALFDPTHVNVGVFD